jgi:hypothetical protein
MTQEDKQLSLKDLSARLPYHTIVSTGEEDLELVRVDILNEKIYLFSESTLEFDISDIKPYLRPMSSMTEEECKYCAEHFGIQSTLLIGGQKGMIMPMEASPMFIDWLNEHHFDYRGLIEKGLALEAPEGMYNHYDEEFNDGYRNWSPRDLT